MNEAVSESNVILEEEIKVFRKEKEVELAEIMN